MAAVQVKHTLEVSKKCKYLETFNLLKLSQNIEDKTANG